MRNFIERLVRKFYPPEKIGAKVTFKRIDDHHGKVIVERDGERHEVTTICLTEEQVREIGRMRQRRLASG
ncbi:MAG: hypothetical protein H0W28_03565 [Pyrinomonadaceae bacterium]|nr:hypothetical protein [Pyrinomonadaceae bacterium]